MIQRTQVGFDLSTSEEVATERALTRWRGIAQRAGRTPVGEPTTRLERSRGLEGVGQFDVLVEGETTDGPDDGHE